MGLFDRIRDDIEEYTDSFDTSAEKMPKGFGFDPQVCEGCQFRGDATGRPCGLCGCPTVSGLFMDIRQQPPAECPRLTQHERR